MCKDTGWIEVEPVKNAYQQSHHTAPNRFAVAPSNTEDGNDLVVDPRKVPEGKRIEYPLPPTLTVAGPQSELTDYPATD